tara:strand:+ start:255 stop:596 length:342 start_codon:yes stop_codon:yes gene_type:complete
MAYEAVPEGVEIEKLTSAQRDALSRYKIHENINTFLANENVPVVIGGFIAGFLGVRLAEDIITDLESRVGKLSEDVKQGIKDTVDIKLPTFGAPAPVQPTISDLITYIKAEIG